MEASSTEPRTEELSCAQRVNRAWQSRRTALKAMLNPSAEDLQFDGHTSDAVQFVLDDYEVCWLNHDEIRDLTGLDLAHDRRHWNNSERADILAAVFDRYNDKIRETARQAFCEYGLAFDYVAPGTFGDQRTGYWRYQISWGGPSEEIRFYGAPSDSAPARIEFWFLDWFDGAPEDVTSDEIARLVWDEFKDTGTVEHVYREAME